MVKVRNIPLVWAVGVIVLTGLVAWLWQRSGRPVTTSVVPPPAAGASQPDDLEKKLESLSKELREEGDPGKQKQRLAEIRQILSGGPSEKVPALVLHFLESKADAPTGQGFKIGSKGFLVEAPTLRTFLLDYLGQVDPATAAAYARTILSSMDSPDEWALALRNLARGDSRPEGRALLEQKTDELLRQEEWQQNPSVGYLEAFDAAVYLGGTNLVPVLTGLVRREENPAVAHAAFLALDRLVINDASTTLAALEVAPELMQGRELTRANYFARADVRDSGQRQVLEKYLLNPRLGQAEMAAFAGVYPNANFMFSANLLSQVQTPDRAALTARDAEALRVMTEWLADSRFAKLRPELEKARTRLEGFVRQAQGK